MSILERPRVDPTESCIHVLETDRLVLRAPRLGDAKAIATLADDRRIAENTLRIPHPYGPGDAADWIAATAAGDDETFVITLRNGLLIGACDLRRRGPEGSEIGYWLGAPYWGKGFATEAARALVDHAFADPDCDALVAGARISNPASRRVLEKCGFQWTGVVLHRIRAISSSAPFDRFRLDRGIWTALKDWGRTETRVRCVA
ncbi:GNAT family N-acetyltransferase [Rhodoplanes serenus]|jgi:RimJ/RimL family protein N-acetyltransferase|uniref:GNAT family N-acetyltransferase n=1 Tax=Rhodoplanes serenus TaxID=200615 RepID=A0A327KC14_9BRAD|nr:GNAT family N-acetyltransferase [Rhodoplanes serenus]MBI5114474.1 GNAT family N-acetyltransferase [Rhodovulum sp.]MTW19156.1 GNAT family N-acetyltransferase [Rhodoplanes serenus]RAI35691.1 GNAT family N-acetyltransferase [Rhodoplanes serenus]VCU08189.1 Putative ribosomal N-acetyltransferase YdaF [Rhodoplanes serenus]